MPGELRTSIIFIALLLTACFATAQTAQSTFPPGSPQLITTADLLKALQDPAGTKPVVLNVGPSLIFMQAHIAGAEFIGATSSPQGITSLRNRAKTMQRDVSIVLYCGCCPWEHCPNVAPAYRELEKLGFKQVKILYLPNNFGADWVDKGYPVIRGQ
jgi:hypothetical protein